MNACSVLRDSLRKHNESTNNVTYVFLERNGEEVDSSQQSAAEVDTDVETDIDVGKELMEVSSSQQSAVKGGDL